MRGGFSGAQRVYEYTISWEEDGPLELSELVTSPNNEGLVDPSDLRADVAKTDAALGYDKAQLQRRPRRSEDRDLMGETDVRSTTPDVSARNRSDGIIYEDSVTNEYPDIFDVGLSGGDPFSVELLVTGLYQATIRIEHPMVAREPASRVLVWNCWAPTTSTGSAVTTGCIPG